MLFNATELSRFGDGTLEGSLGSLMKASDIFKCTQCGDCCKGYGGAFVTSQDIEAITGYINTDPNGFVDNYCRLSGKNPVLGQKGDGYCIFWNGICAIHPVKPRMCKSWPFIKSVLIDTKNWQIMAGLCPGMRIDVSDSVIRDCVANEIKKLEDGEA